MSFSPDEFRRRMRSSWVPSSRELILGTKADGSPYRIPLSRFDEHPHCQIVGTTGGGKTRLLVRLFQELAWHSDGAVVFLDPTGNAYDLCRRWAYAEGLDDRLVLVDPAEERLVVGFDPVAPWPRQHHLQAAVSWDNIRRAMDTQDFSVAPLLEQWMCNTFYALITTGLTMHEAEFLMDFHDARIRNAVIGRMPESTERNDWITLDRITRHRNIAQAIQQWTQTVGSSYRRIRHYTGTNEFLRRMLGTKQHTLNFTEIVDGRKLVLVNLSPFRGGVRALSDADQRMLGLQLVTALIEECFRRTRASGLESVPVYSIIDECQHFISPEVERVLTEGRQFNLQLFLAHRSLVELEDQKSQNARLLTIVSDCAQTKIVFGGLGWRTAQELAWQFYGPHLESSGRLKEVKHEQKTWRQLHHVEDVTIAHDASGGARARGSGAMSGSAEQFAPADSFFGSNELVGLVHNSAFSSSLSEVDSWVSGATHGKMVVPEPPFQEITPVFWTADEQIIRLAGKLKGQPRQHATIVIGNDDPVSFRVADVTDPPVDQEEAHGRDLDVMQALPYYTEPARIEAEILDRRNGLIGELPGAQPRRVVREKAAAAAEASPAAPEVQEELATLLKKAKPSTRRKKPRDS